MPDRDSVERTYSRLEEFSRGLSSRAREGLERTRGLIESMYDDTVRNSLRILGRVKRGLFRDDVIQFLDDQTEIATAPMTMRRWILAHPFIRSRYDTQSIDAWGSKPGQWDLEGKGYEDLFYRAATNGLATKNEKGEWWSEYTFGGCSVPGAGTISLEEQMDILATWDIIDDCIADGIDPTSVMKERL
ncbi:hypothetical protein [Pectobacterium phage vB_ParM-25]|nr:hypothetical protein [Pectobacterium phage vB_ParM-25]